MSRSRTGGFSTLELLITTGLLAIVVGSLATMLNNMAKGHAAQLDKSEIQQNQRYAVDTMLRQVRGAGNDPQGIGVVAFDMDPLGDGQRTAVRIQSDNNPPNGSLADPFEDVTFSLSNNTLTLQDAATGNTTEVAQNISALQFSYFDASGNAAATSAEVARVQVTLTGVSSHLDPNTRQLRTFNLTDEVAVRSSSAVGGSSAGQGASSTVQGSTTTMVVTTTTQATTTTTSSVTTTTDKKDKDKG